MAENDLLKRLLDAGMTFTAMTQARAEDLIRDLVRAGEVQAEQAQSVIDELVDRSRRNSERLIDAVRAEIRQQMANLGLATKGDVERLERKVAEVSAGTPSARKATTRKATTRKAAARRASKATKTTARKAGAKKAGAKKAGAKKAGAKKATKAAKAPRSSKASKASKTSKASKASKASRARSTR
jgi:polyhydroxyalkanoate synthesis regulator phasin